MPGKSPSYAEAYRSNEFWVQIEGQDWKVDKVSGLSEGTSGVIEIYDPKTNGAFKISSGVVKFDTLVLEKKIRGTPEDIKFYNWFASTYNADTGGMPGIEGTFSSQKSGKNFNIYKLHFGKKVLSWIITGAWIKSLKYNDLEGGAENTFNMTIEIEHQGISRKAHFDGSNTPK
ncbi:MAG: hypothetical protein D6805_05620 [Planctomycetota bacterium]|nr:MAG: hypothetical protein D6805_05620 [Planctomycetota bacterium]